MSLVILKTERTATGALKAAQVGAFGPKGDLRAMQTIPATLIPIELHSSLHNGSKIDGELEFRFSLTSRSSNFSMPLAGNITSLDYDRIG